MSDQVHKKTINTESDVTVFSHKDLLKITKTTLNELIEKDSLLRDLPADVSVDEVKAQLALEHGQSMTVYMKRADGEVLPIVVSNFTIQQKLKSNLFLLQNEH